MKTDTKLAQPVSAPDAGNRPACRFCGHELKTTFVDLGMSPQKRQAGRLPASGAGTGCANFVSVFIYVILICCFGCCVDYAKTTTPARQ